MIGAAHGLVGCALVFAFSDRYTLAKDWPLAALLVVISAGTYRVAARARAGLLGVSLSGTAGLMAGGWLGFQFIGDYERRVPIPPEDRGAWIVTKDGKRKIDLGRLGMEEEKVERVPIGAPIGMLVGWALGAAMYLQIAGNLTEPNPDPPPAGPDQT
jgi:hypothetical protein